VHRDLLMFRRIFSREHFTLGYHLYLVNKDLPNSAEDCAFEELIS
jgi:hypothetical protein